MVIIHFYILLFALFFVSAVDRWKKDEQHAVDDGKDDEDEAKRCGNSFTLLRHKALSISS